MKTAVGFYEETYGTAEEGPDGHLIVDDTEDGMVQSIIDGLRQWNVDGERRLLNDYDLMRTAPVRMHGISWASILEATKKDRAEIAAWRDVAHGRRRADSVATSHLWKV